MRNLLFIVAVHGDEGFAVDILRSIERQYDRQDYGYDWIIGNPRAFQQNVRFTENDLNRSAPGAIDSPIYEQRKAAEIVRFSQNYDAVIDIHGSVASCGVVTIIPNPTAQNIALAQTVPLSKNVIWYSPRSTANGPLTQHVNRPAVEIECGPKSDPKIQTQLARVVRQIITANRQNAQIKPPKQEFFTVVGPKPGVWDDDVQDFKPILENGNRFYAFMSAQYPGIVCYKMQKTTPQEAAV